MTTKDIAVSFSNGHFDRVYNSIAVDAVWEVVEEDTFAGKDAIIAQCEQVAGYFRSVTTDFKTLNLIADGNIVAVNGTADFTRDEQTVSFVSACDIYEFDDNGMIRRITSYCIQRSF